MTQLEFEKSLTSRDRDNIASGFKNNFEYAFINGPAIFYRFVGYNEEGKENDPHGCWWFSRKTFDDFDMKAKRLEKSFNEFAMYRLALPDNWNSKLHIFEWNIPDGVTLGCVKGIVKYQSIHGTTRERRQNNPYYDKESTIKDNVFMIGGDTQYYFRYDDVKQYPKQQIIKF